MEKLKNNSISVKTKRENCVRIFYCLPMSGRSDEDILNQIDEECVKISDLIRMISMDVDIEILCNYKSSDKNIGFSPDVKHQSLYFLGRGIASNMMRADIVIFGKGWKDSRGCRIEKAICEEYNLKHFCI